MNPVLAVALVWRSAFACVIQCQSQEAWFSALLGWLSAPVVRSSCHYLVEDVRPEDAALHFADEHRADTVQFTKYLA